MGGGTKRKLLISCESAVEWELKFAGNEFSSFVPIEKMMAKYGIDEIIGCNYTSKYPSYSNSFRVNDEIIGLIREATCDVALKLSEIHGLNIKQYLRLRVMMKKYQEAGLNQNWDLVAKQFAKSDESDGEW